MLPQRWQATRRWLLAEKKRKGISVRGVGTRSCSLLHLQLCALISRELTRSQDVAGTGLQVRKIPKLCGVGVFCLRSFAAGDTVVQYAGQTITTTEANKRDKLRAEVCPGCFMFVVCTSLLFCCWMRDAARRTRRHTHAV